MTSKEWLNIIMQAKDTPKGMDKLIEKYGEMVLDEYKIKCGESHKTWCHCTKCDHNWLGMVFGGTIELQCPVCLNMSGITRQFPEDN